jgi:hypothetical protein
MLNFDGNINIIINLNVDRIEFLSVSEMADCTKMDKYCNVKLPVARYCFNVIYF